MGETDWLRQSHRIAELEQEMNRVGEESANNADAYMSLTHQWATARKEWEEHRAELERENERLLFTVSECYRLAMLMHQGHDEDHDIFIGQILHATEAVLPAPERGGDGQDAD